MYRILYTDSHPSLQKQMMSLWSTHSHNTRNASLFTLSRYSKANIHFCTLVQNFGMSFLHLVIANFLVIGNQSTSTISINIETIPVIFPSSFPLLTRLDFPDFFQTGKKLTLLPGWFCLSTKRGPIGAPVEPFATIVQWCLGGFEGFLSWVTMVTRANL